MSRPRRTSSAAAPRGRRPRDAALAAEARSNARAATLGWAGLLALLVLAVFGRTVRHGFVDWDDPTFVTAPPAYNPPTLASLAGLWSPRPDPNTFFVPVLYTIWWAVALVARDPAAPAAQGLTADPAGPFNPAPYHALNVAAHATATALTFLLLRRFLRGAPAAAGANDRSRVMANAPAFVGAALFALHPVQVEPVAWASTFYTSASAALALAATACYVRFGDARAAATLASEAETAPRPAWSWYAAATALFVASLLTKPSTVALPLILFAAEALVLRPSRGLGADGRTRDLLRSAALLVPWLVAGLAVGLLTSRYRQNPEAIFTPTLAQRLLVAGDAVAFYVRTLAWPVGLVPDYGRSPQRVLANPAAAAGWTVAVAVLTVGVAALARRAPRAAVAWAAFVVGMAATLGLVPFEYQRYSTVADRYAYLSMFGVALAAAAGVAWLTAVRPGTARPRLAPAGVYGGAAAVLVVLGTVAFLQVGRWRDTDALFTHTLEVRPDSAVAHTALLASRTREGRYDDALAHGRLATAANPSDARLWQFQAFAVMESARRQGPSGRPRFDEAADLLRQALKVARAGQDDIYAALGAALAQGGHPTDAEDAFREAARLNPANVDAHRNLAVLYRGQGRLDDAVRAAEAAVALDPASPQLQGMLAQLRAERAAKPATLP